MAAKLRAITLWAEPPHRRGPRGLWTLVVKWADSPHRVEVRGAYDVEDSDFQRVIDRLPGPLVGGELFAGNIATVNERMYSEAWPVLSEVLARGMASVAGFGALPVRGTIPMRTAQRALKRLGSKAKACKITPELLREGMDIEREHRDVTGGSVMKTAKIAAAHICERRDYYKRIKRYVEK